MPSNTQMTEAALFSRLDDPIDAPIVLTSNPRAARTLQIRHGLWRQQNNKTAWHTAKILTWNTWLEEIWDALLLSGATQQALLTSAQELYLWQEVLRSAQDAECAPLWRTGPMAELAQETLRLMEEHCISRSQIELAASGKDTRTFLRWLRTFQEQCADRKFLCPSALAHTLAEKIDRAPLPVPGEMLLIGFDRIKPVQKLLLDGMRQAGLRTDFPWLVPGMPAGPVPAIIETDTVEEELHAAAFWTRKQLEKDLCKHIGILVTSDMEIRGAIDRTFRRSLATSSLDIHSGAQRVPYEFTMGSPFDQLPQIRVALLLLRWLTQPVTFDEASFLVLSGHVGEVTWTSSARLDAAIKNDPQTLGGRLDFHWLLRQLKGNSTFHAARFQQCMTDVAALAERSSILPEKYTQQKLRSHAEWCDTIRQLLVVAEWSLLTTKNSAEFQALKQWEQLLDEISTLDTIVSPVPFSEMLETLGHAAGRTLYAQETLDAPVQIMGVAESSGLTFDAVWFLGASAGKWPQHGHANPWVPWSLQRKTGMPYASPQADYSYARNATERVIAGSRESIFSFPMEESGQETRAAHRPDIMVRTSPILLDMFPAVTPVHARKLVPEIGATGNGIEDWKTVPVENEKLVPFEGTKVRHGVDFLRRQAACPFQAFAELRLSATAPETPEIGVTAAMQGSLVHEVLRDLWGLIKDQDTLHALTEEHRLRELNTCIQRSLKKLPSSAPLDKMLLSTEAERLRDRLLRWMKIEEQRPNFSVLDCEKQLKDVCIGDLQMDCRIDRIDKVREGLALIDYKSGKAAASACDGGRPDEPQLPAYAVLMRNHSLPEGPLCGVAIACLQAIQLGFKIVHSVPHIFTKEDSNNTRKRTPILTTLEELMEKIDDWEKILGRLSEDFRSGVASVDPKVPRKTCTYCNQAIFCRVAEAQFPVNQVEDEDTEGQGNDQEHEE